LRFGGAAGRSVVGRGGGVDGGGGEHRRVWGLQQLLVSEWRIRLDRRRRVEYELEHELGLELGVELGRIAQEGP
jgi:hypothetical protein